ncbi:MAG TPA: cytochrome c [Thermoanaerobaculales bacterium]|nr:cytochrome c [Thermoanaerobaculales bacterium]HQN96676.1 cytochrome c [Thermoanaerobaculales bacterium]HQP44731.1 cytochrome c [Thermoanaerobaculales bacterium]
MKVPRWLTYLVVVLVVMSWVPLALILRARAVKSDKPRIHIVQDMDNQPKLGPQAGNRLFADRRAMRPPVTGAIARGELREDEGLYRGAVGGAWLEQIPLPVTEQLMRRGRERYDIFCSPCHGLAGHGDGMVSKRAEALQEGTWTLPASFHTELVRGRPAGHLYNSIANGIRNMPGYGAQIPVEDRWAIVAYLRALQRSQGASVEDVPPELRAQLR